jgi:hypothetical protein
MEVDMSDSAIRRDPETLRHGSAPLEFMMCLPVLLMLFLGLLWLGSSLVTQTEVSVEARHLAWSRREAARDNAGPAKVDHPLMFRLEGSADGEASRAPNVKPRFVSPVDPRSVHSVLGDSWSDLDRSDELGRKRYINKPLSRRAYWDAGETLVANFRDQLRDYFHQDYGAMFQQADGRTLDKSSIDFDDFVAQFEQKFLESITQEVGWSPDQITAGIKQADEVHAKFKKAVVQLRDGLVKVQEEVDKAKKAAGPLDSLVNGVLGSLPAEFAGPVKSLMSIALGGLKPVIKALDEYLREIDDLEKLRDQFKAMLPGGSNELLPNEVYVK